MSNSIPTRAISPVHIHQRPPARTRLARVRGGQGVGAPKHTLGGFPASNRLARVGDRRRARRPQRIIWQLMCCGRWGSLAMPASVQARSALCCATQLSEEVVGSTHPATRLLQLPGLPGLACQHSSGPTQPSSKPLPAFYVTCCVRSVDWGFASHQCWSPCGPLQQARSSKALTCWPSIDIPAGRVCRPGGKEHGGPQIAGEAPDSASAGVDTGTGPEHAWERRLWYS